MALDYSIVSDYFSDYSSEFSIALHFTRLNIVAILFTVTKEKTLTTSGVVESTLYKEVALDRVISEVVIVCARDCLCLEFVVTSSTHICTKKTKLCLLFALCVACSVLISQ